MTVIAGSGSGELLDRDDYQRLIDLVATRRYDLVFCEDLGRIVRRIHAHLVCEHCEDHNTRLYAKNDRVDTAFPNWREASIFLRPPRFRSVFTPGGNGPDGAAEDGHQPSTACPRCEHGRTAFSSTGAKVYSTGFICQHHASSS